MSIVGTAAKPAGGGGTVPPSAVTCSSQAACSGLTRCGAVGPTGTPKIQLMPTRISVMPITRMIVPVTTGGKNRSMRLAIGAISTPMTPAAMIEPKIIRAPSAPGWVSAIDTIGPTEAKVTPIITGMRTPNQGVKPSDCRIETTPQQNRSAEIRKATSSGGSCSARPMISGHGDGAGVHDEHVLQAEREQLRRRQHLVDGMDGCGHATVSGVGTAIPY